MAGEIETVETVDGSVELEPVRDRSLFHTSDPVEVLQQAKRVAQALKDEIAAAGMVQRIGGREFVRVEGIQTGLVMLGCSTRIVWSRPIEDGWESRCEVVNGTGRVIGAGEAMCTRSERNWARRDAYALRSMAQTRALGKAGRTVLSFVLTLSGHPGVAVEEMDTVEPGEPQEASIPEWAQPADPRAAAQTIHGLLTAAGVQEPDKVALEIGQRIFDRCDRVVPVCVEQALNHARVAVLADRQEASP